MPLERCVNCGLYGNKSQITPKVVKSIVGTTYYMILLCMHCHPKENFCVEYGYKREISEVEAQKYLEPQTVENLK